MDNNKGGGKRGGRWQEGVRGKGRKLYVNNNKKIFKKEEKEKQEF